MRLPGKKVILLHSQGCEACEAALPLYMNAQEQWVKEHPKSNILIGACEFDSPGCQNYFKRKNQPFNFKYIPALFTISNKGEKVSANEVATNPGVKKSQASFYAFFVKVNRGG